MTQSDVLSDVLKAVRLRGAVYFRAAFCAPWGIEMGAGAYANYHLVNSGECWLRESSTGKLTRLSAGDAVMLPKGDAHALLCSPSAAIEPAQQFLESTRRSDAEADTVFGGDGSVTTALTCGHFEFDRVAEHPLFNRLDSVIHVSAQSGNDSRWLSMISDLATHAANSGASGEQIVVDRLAEALLIQLLLRHLSERPDSESFVAAATHGAIGQALELMHTDPIHDWTVAELATRVGMSRSAFASRFHTLVGESPIVYLARWRLLKARELLTNTRDPLNRVADAVGYSSEFAFAKAFKRRFGTTPGQFRKGV